MVEKPSLKVPAASIQWSRHLCQPQWSCSQGAPVLHPPRCPRQHDGIGSEACVRCSCVAFQGAASMHSPLLLCIVLWRRAQVQVLSFLMPVGHRPFPIDLHLNDKRLGKYKMLVTGLLLRNFPIRFIAASINSN